MRTAMLRPAALAMLLPFWSGALSAQAAAHPRRAASSTTSSAGKWSPREPGSSPAEEARYRERAMKLRDRIIAAAEWNDFDQAACNPGSLRVFARDTANRTGEKVLDDIEALERIIIARGVDSSLDTRRARALIRTVVGWEAASIRPRWDTRSGEAPRNAIATGLSGEFLNPATKKCESYVPYDSVTIVLPEVTGLSMPPVKGGGTTIRLLVGEAGLHKGRDDFYAANRSATEAIFNYIRLRAVVVWRDFAVVGVNRPAENKGVRELPKGAGGAAYIFHRVGEEWRLLTITRTWS